MANGYRTLASGVSFSDQELQVDGEVDGTIEVCGHNLTIGPRARVRAEIKTQNVSIVRTVEGRIDTSERIELCSQCRVLGKIKTRRIGITDGAYFQGNIEVVQARAVVPIPPALLPVPNRQTEASA